MGAGPQCVRNLVKKVNAQKKDLIPGSLDS
jgi:hypothetical protein